MKLLFLLSLAIGAAHATTFGCSNSDISDTDRQTFYGTHNNNRRSMAKGDAPNNNGNLPSGQNVYEMNYDCNLEQCSMSGLTGINGSYIALTGPLWSGSGPFDGNTMSQNQINDWWGKAQQYGVNEDLIAQGGDIQPWETIANGKNTAFGCAYGQCFDDSQPDWKYKFIFACIYNNVLASGDTVYEAGSACSADSDCTYMSGSTCNDGLCHTDSLSGRKLFYILRSSGVRGLEPDAAGSYAPMGKQSLKYKWDCDIEANAIAWGNTCAMKHSDDGFRNKNGEQWGENLFTYSNQQNPKQVAVSSSNGWWAELAEKGVGQENIFTDEVSKRKVGHYTQMAWGTSYKLGCSVNYCSGQTWVVCQYGPSGNWGNELIYEIGDPCTDDSGCPEGATCSVDEGLCVMP